MRYVIIGGSAAGISAAEAIRELDPEGEIWVVSAEPTLPYYRPLIPLLLADEHPQELLFWDSDLLARLHLRFLSGRKVESIDAAQRSVALDDGSTVVYDRLLLATGASPIVPSIPGIRSPGVFVLRTLQDAQSLREAARKAKRAVIIGAGRVGLKVALALRSLGLQVAVIEMLPRPLPQQLDDESAPLLMDALHAQGIALHLGSTVEEVVVRRRRARGVILSGGKELGAEVIVVAVGVTPNSDLAQRAGIATRRGVLVDPTLATSVQDIWAAGDVVEISEVVTGVPTVSGTWTNAVEMGRFAGSNMAGRIRQYPGAFALLNSIVLAGVPIISVGEIFPREGDEVAVARDGRAYRKLILRDDRLVGALFVGEVAAAGLYTHLIKSGRSVASLKPALRLPRFHYGYLLTTTPVVTDRYVSR